MGGTKGYRSYRGRGSRGKAALAAALVLVILAALGFLWVQEYIVYDADGNAHFEPPWQAEKTPPVQESDPPENVEIIVQEPERPEELTAFSVAGTPLTQSAWQEEQVMVPASSSLVYNAAAVTLKDSAGHIYYAAAGAPAGAVATAEDTMAALAELTESGLFHTIARMSCFLDPIAALADVEGMGLKNTGGYIFYDGNGLNWLDPAKPAARQYLCALAQEIASLGFDELLLTDLGYPIAGKLDKIDYGGADRAAGTRLFLEELRSALAEYGVAISVELPAEVILSGSDDTAGLALADIAPLVDRIYAVAAADQIPALTAAVEAAGERTAFVPELAAPDLTVAGSCLILGE